MWVEKNIQIVLWTPYFPNEEELASDVSSTKEEKPNDTHPPFEPGKNIGLSRLSTLTIC